MPLSVTELVCRLKHTVEVNVGEQSVVGEIGSCKAASSGHIYFTLKDAHCQLQCALYSFRARSLRISALMKDLPDDITIDITPLGLDKRIKASDVQIKNVAVVSDKDTIICGVKTTRNVTAAASEE